MVSMRRMLQKLKNICSRGFDCGLSDRNSFAGCKVDRAYPVHIAGYEILSSTSIGAVGEFDMVVYDEKEKIALSMKSSIAIKLYRNSIDI